MAKLQAELDSVKGQTIVLQQASEKASLDASSLQEKLESLQAELAASKSSLAEANEKLRTQAAESEKAKKDWEAKSDRAKADQRLKHIKDALLQAKSVVEEV